MRDSIRFLLNAALVEVRDCDPTTTVLRWLRETKQLSGTKEGCAEGDCGACTVLVGRLHQGHIDYEPINACIAFLPMLDGLSVITVEGVEGPAGALHPCQQAMVACHGSQCGFCTPGFVMTLYGDDLREQADSGARLVPVDDVLAGNLCRCTGYAPIRAAAAEMRRLPRPDWDDGRYTTRLVGTLAAIQQDDEIEISGNGRTMRIVATEDQFAEYYAANPDARIIAGATDVGLWVTKHGRDLPRLLHLRRSRLAQARAPLTNDVLDGVDVLRLSAFASHADCTANDELGTVELLRRFAGPQVRSLGTVGGNIANASPIGDLAPVFLARGAIVHLRRGSALRTLPIDQFFIAYGKTALEAGEFITGFHFAASKEPQLFAVYKVSKRFDDDISAVCGAFCLSISDDKVARARVAYGGMAATPKRAIAVEQALLGKPFTRATIDSALDAYARDFNPLSDMRATADYRLAVARNLLVRFFIEHAAPDTKTRLVGNRAVSGAGSW